MSDPVTNAEVEDVLSSIRRLVSDDIRAVRPARDSGDTHQVRKADGTAPPDRLVLTPALRVADGRDVAESDVGQGAAEADVSGTEIAPDVADDCNTQQVTVDGNDNVQETADGLDNALEEPTELEGESSEATDDVISDDPVIEAKDEPFLFLGHLRAERLLGFAAAGAPDVPEESPGQGGLHKPSEGAETPDAPAVAQYLGHAVGPEVVNQPENQEKRAAPPMFFRRTTPQELTAKIAALEDVIAKTPDQWEPDGTDEDPYSGTAVQSLSWEDDVDLDGSGKPVSKENTETVSTNPEPVITQEPEAVVSGETDETSPSDSVDRPPSDTAVFELGPEMLRPEMLNPDDAVLDEDALRELVSDIVRQELQGALGERITRNVRKLVRREIQRALVAQDFD